MKNVTDGVTTDPLKSVEHWITVLLCLGYPPIVSVNTLPPPGTGVISVLMLSGKISTLSLLPLTIQKIVVEALHMYICLSFSVTIKTGGEGTVMKSETKIQQ